MLAEIFMLSEEAKCREAANDLSGSWARAWLVSGCGLLREWRRRYRSRRELSALSAYQIRDFCLDPMAAERDAAKPFWRA